jgi:hypothetical protein
MGGGPMDQILLGEVMRLADAAWEHSLPGRQAVERDCVWRELGRLLSEATPPPDPFRRRHLRVHWPGARPPRPA